MKAIELAEVVLKTLSELGAGPWLVQCDVAMRFDPLAGRGFGSPFWSFAKSVDVARASERFPDLLIAAACHHYAHVLTIAEPWMTADIHRHVQELAEDFVDGGDEDRELRVNFSIGTTVSLDPWPELPTLPDPLAETYRIRLLAGRGARHFRYSIRLRYQFNKVLIPASLFLVIRDVVRMFPSSSTRLGEALRVMAKSYESRPLRQIAGHWRIAEAGLAAIGVMPNA